MAIFIVISAAGCLTSQSAIAASHGFSGQSHFVREFRRELGLTPGEYRQQHGRA